MEDPGESFRDRRRVWTGEDLDRLRQEPDPGADAVAAAYLEGKESAAPVAFLRSVAQTRYGGGEDTDPVIRAWLDDRPPLPAWADPDRLRSGCDFFSEYGLDIGMGLFLKSLPTAYAAADGVKVLALTGRLETDTRQRIMETGQFLLDVTEPGALEPGGNGYAAVRHVRLMHAGVRHLVLTHPDVEHGADGDGPMAWPKKLGAPVNQEFLIGTLISFSFTMLQLLDMMEIEYDRRQAEDFVTLWNTVGFLLGIEEDLLPFTIDDLEQLDRLIRARNFRPSPEGRKLTSELLHLLHGMVPRWAASVPSTLMRLLMGDHDADIIGVPKKGWSAWLLIHGRPVLRVLTFLQLHSRIMRSLARRSARHTWQGFIDDNTRGRGRPDFAIPDHLARRWGVTPRPVGPGRS